MLKFKTNYITYYIFSILKGWTPLHCAASCNNHAILKQLIENGACPYSITNKSEIALNLFDRSGDYEAGAEYIELVNESMGVVNSRKVY